MRCVNTRRISTVSKTTGVREYLDVGCGECYACRLKKTDHWIDRLDLESRCHVHQPIFLTLTYSPENVPKNEKGILCLKLRDVQLWLKRLRKLFPGCSIRYIYLGEYGGRTARPHYHAIIFGIPSNPELPSIIESTWKLGHVRVSYVNDKRIAYCASFHINSSAWPPGATKPFVQYSRNPGLGRSFCDLQSSKERHLPYLDISTGEIRVDERSLQFTRRSGRLRPLPPYIRRVFYPEGYPLPIKFESTEEYLDRVYPGLPFHTSRRLINSDYKKRMNRKIKEHGKYI